MLIGKIIVMTMSSPPLMTDRAVRLPHPAALAVAAGVLGMCALIGRRNAPDPSHPQTRRWYHRLDKPGYTPPGPLFGVTWPLLETGLAVSGYRLLRQAPSPRRDVALGLWLGNSVLIGGWTELFFRRKALGASALLCGTMVATSAAFVAATARQDRTAAALGVPLVAWLTFATVLATRVWQDNRGQMGDRTLRAGESSPP